MHIKVLAALTVVAALSLTAVAPAEAPLYKSGTYTGKTKQSLVKYSGKVSFAASYKKRTITKLSAWVAVHCEDDTAFALKPTLSKLKIKVSKKGSFDKKYNPGDDHFEFYGKLKGAKAAGHLSLVLADYTDADGDHGQCASF